ncbi:hypothetical protein CTI14_72230, partial [Methylobacterium radiotolerans]
PGASGATAGSTSGLIGDVGATITALLPRLQAKTCGPGASGATAGSTSGLIGDVGATITALLPRLQAKT